MISLATDSESFLTSESYGPENISVPTPLTTQNLIVVEVENVETQDCEFVSEKMSEAQRKDLCKELEKHPCLWETCGPEYKNKPRRSRALDLSLIHI